MQIAVESLNGSRFSKFTIVLFAIGFFIILRIIIFVHKAFGHRPNKLEMNFFGFPNFGS